MRYPESSGGIRAPSVCALMNFWWSAGVIFSGELRTVACICNKREKSAKSVVCAAAENVGTNVGVNEAWTKGNSSDVRFFVRERSDLCQVPTGRKVPICVTCTTNSRQLLRHCKVPNQASHQQQPPTTQGQPFLVQIATLAETLEERESMRRS